jgi:hypothetical protein
MRSVPGHRCRDGAEPGAGPGTGAPLAGVTGLVARNLAGAVFTLRQHADWRPARRPGAVRVLPDPARACGDGQCGVMAACAALALRALGDDSEAAWPGTRQLMTGAPAHLRQGPGYDRCPSGPGDGSLVTRPLLAVTEAGR